jgi:hypothetical protein
MGAGFAALTWFADPTSFWVRHWGLMQIIYFGLFEVIATAIGVIIGRPVARAMLKILTPPKIRQHLAFLWIVDGKLLRVKDQDASKLKDASPPQ